MYCPSCGVALSQKTKYCNRCGARLLSKKSGEGRNPAEKRLDDYLDGLFWITVFGLGLILGGTVLLKRVLNLGEGLIIAYLVLSSTAFIINFSLSLWQIYRMTREAKTPKPTGELENLDTNKLEPAREPLSLEPLSLEPLSLEPLSLEAPPSVTENTTRGLDQISKERVTR